MKRFLIISVTCFMAVSLCACGKTKENNTDNKTELSEIMAHGDEKDITDDSKSTTEKGTEKVESRPSDDLEDITENVAEGTTEDKTNGATEDITENAESTSKKTEDIDLEAENESQKEDDDITLDPFVGEYNSYDVDEPDLEIQKMQMEHIKSR